MRHKGKIHPSYSPNKDSSSMSSLKILPAAILAIAMALPLEDREVLAYMITRSMNLNPSVFLEENSKKSSKNSSAFQKPPLFDCECFECYTSYWFRWDSSVNRELIHQAIEAFEEGLNNGELRKREKKKREKKGRRGRERILLFAEGEGENQSPAPEIQEWGLIEQGTPEYEVSPSESADFVSDSGDSSELTESMSLDVLVEAEVPEVAVVLRGGTNNHKGLARKVLPDVLGLFSSRLWSLWNPNV